MLKISRVPIEPLYSSFLTFHDIVALVEITYECLTYLYVKCAEQILGLRKVIEDHALES